MSGKGNDKGKERAMKISGANKPSKPSKFSPAANTKDTKPSKFKDPGNSSSGKGFWGKFF